MDNTNKSGPNEQERRLLTKLLAKVPDGVGPVRVYLPEKDEENAILEYEGVKHYFSIKDV